MKYYAGIGARGTPEEVQAVMKMLAVCFGQEGYTLRSGGAVGADSAFEEGCDAIGGSKEIFLPWAKLNGNPSPLHHISEEAYEIASQYHPAWHKLRSGGRKMMARNVHQVLGADCKSPSLFVLCWTPDGKSSGGTGQAIRIANDRGIPVHNLFNLSAPDIIKMEQEGTLHE